MADLQDMKIDYVEFTSPDLEATQSFFSTAFGWSFVEYGPDYCDIQNSGIGGGIERSELRSPLIVLRARDLEGAFETVKASGAEITKEIFEFPGGRRFEFKEPGGNRMAVWNDK